MNEILYVLGPASYAQARIWLNERNRFDPDQPQVAIYNMPFIYHLSTNNTLSISQLYHSLQLIIHKHLSLRTSLIFDTEQNQLRQRIIDSEVIKSNQLFTFIESIFESDEQLTSMILMKEATLNILIYLKASSFDVILFIINKYHRMVLFLIKIY